MKNQYPFLKLVVGIPKDKEMDVQNIQSWLAHQPHLPKLSAEHIILFLHSCYYSGERTKETIDNYFTVRIQSPELFTGWQWSKLQNLWENLYLMAPFPKTTPEDYKVLLYRFQETDPSKFNFQEALKAFFSFNDVRISEDGLVNGYIVIFDMMGSSLGHLARVSTCMSLVKKFMIYIQECHPVRLKAVHVINTLPFIDSVLALVKPLIQSKLMDMIHLHSDLSTIDKFVPLELFPADYTGGMAPHSKLLHDEHVQMVNKNYRDWLNDSEKLKADLKKRITKPKNQSIELEGSFKTLNID